MLFLQEWESQSSVSLACVSIIRIQDIFERFKSLERKGKGYEGRGREGKYTSATFASALVHLRNERRTLGARATLNR